MHTKLNTLISVLPQLWRIIQVRQGTHHGCRMNLIQWQVGAANEELRGFISAQGHKNGYSEE